MALSRTWARTMWRRQSTCNQTQSACMEPWVAFTAEKRKTFSQGNALLMISIRDVPKCAAGACTYMSARVPEYSPELLMPSTCSSCESMKSASEPSWCTKRSHIPVVLTSYKYTYDKGQLGVSASHCMSTTREHLRCHKHGRSTQRFRIVVAVIAITGLNVRGAQECLFVLICVPPGLQSFIFDRSKRTSTSECQGQDTTTCNVTWGHRGHEIFLDPQTESKSAWWWRCILVLVSADSGV